MGQWKGRGLKSITQHLRVHIRDRQVSEIPGEMFVGITGKQK